MKKLATLCILLVLNVTILPAQNVGIGTMNPLGRLHVDGGSVIFTGDTGSANITGPGKRLMWMPGKAAFRVGLVDNLWNPDAWDELNIGQNSFAAGFSPLASGEGAVAFGSSRAGGTNAFSMGGANSAMGQSAFSFGSYGEAGGNYSFSFGHSSSTIEEFGLAFGQNAIANARYGMAMGEDVTAQSYGSLVIGRFNTVAGNPTSAVISDPVLIVGNGTAFNMRSNAFTLYRNGNLTIAGNLTELSDARLKKDISTVSNSLEKINALSGYNYYWKNTDIQDDALHAGLMAQEVKEQMPELVRQTEGDVLSVNYSGMIPYLVEAIKELKQLQEESKKQAKADINDLQKENERLREQIKKLEQQRLR